MINIVSVDLFRQFVPVNASTDVALISSAINQGQQELLSDIFGYRFLNFLLSKVEDPTYKDPFYEFVPVDANGYPVILKLLQPAIAYYSAVTLITLAHNQINPTEISDPHPSTSPTELKAHYRNMASNYLPPVYQHCCKHGICYKPHHSTSFSPIFLGGRYGVSRS